ncbi:MAG: hypothetical protein HYT31_00605 [Parcubacteria group bacterium]|nr:hypothetical protein [Parcubacteria group bacterium]
MRLKKKEKIILALGAFGALALVGGAGFGAYQKLKPDVVVLPNITDEYREELEAELASVRQKSLENSQDVDARISMGILEQKLGRLSAAERAFKSALKINSRDYIVYMHLGILYGDMERFEDANSALRAATQLEPRDPKPFQALITLYKRHFPGRSDELENIFRAASDYTASPEIWAEYAQFLEDRGDIRQAWVYWSEVSVAEPDNKDAAAHVERLGRALGVGE